MRCGSATTSEFEVTTTVRQAMIEILTFALRAGVDTQRFIDIDSRVQTEFAYQQPGLVRRTTGRHGDGRWLVLQVWASEDEAVAAHRALDESELGTTLAVLIDPGTIRLDRFAGLD